jgi:hypothetical protein
MSNKGGAMLQNVHHEMAAPRASSIYCRWIRTSEKEGARLVAVWIDSEMRCFAKDFAPNSDTEALQQEALDDPGGPLVFSTADARRNRNLKRS